MVIGGLKPDTTYSITVAAYTTKGDGARSKPKLVVTKGAGQHKDKSFIPWSDYKAFVHAAIKVAFVFQTVAKRYFALEVSCHSYPAISC